MVFGDAATGEQSSGEQTDGVGVGVGSLTSVSGKWRPGRTGWSDTARTPF